MDSHYTQQHGTQQGNSQPALVNPSQQDSLLEQFEPIDEGQTRKCHAGKVSLITSTMPKTLGKTYRLTANGLKKETAGHLASGLVDVLSFNDIEEFANILKSVCTNQALCASLPASNSAKIVTKKELDRMHGSDAIARTKEHFTFPFDQRGVMILDYDPPTDALPLSKDQLWELVRSVVPAIAQAGVAWWCSGSSHIYNGAVEMQGLRGQRLYVLVSDLSDIVRCGEVLAKKLWLTGQGRIQVSSSGAKLVRSTFDEAMHERARLDFIGGAICEAPLEQRRGEPIILSDGGWLDTRWALPDLTDAEEARYEERVQEGKLRAESDSLAARAKWVEERRPILLARLKKNGIDSERANERAARCLKSALDNVLFGDFEIELDDTQRITVSTLLDQREKYHGRLTKDPLDPDYQSGKVVGKLYLHGPSPVLHSYAHGGATYTLRRQPHRILYTRGERARAVRALIAALIEEGDIFSKSNHLVQVTKCGLRILKEHSLAHIIDSRVALYAMNAKGDEYPTDIGIELCKIIASQSDGGDFPELLARSTLPYARPDGSIVEVPGYDRLTRIYADFRGDAFLQVAKSPGDSDVVAALRRLWRPWCRFPFATDTDRAAMLAAIMTAVCRPALDIAPAYFIDAPVQSSGKTACSAALQALVTGRRGGVTPYVGGDNAETELSKKVLAMAMSGSGFWLIDNVTGTWRSAVLSALLTDGAINDRILGQSEVINAAARMMICATGNNASLDRDLGRRFIKIRIDSGLESPQKRDFDFDPVSRALEERLEIAQAVLTVIRAYVNAGKPVLGKGTAGFAAWSNLVRQCVLWCSNKNFTAQADIGICGDPANSILEDAGASDDETAALHALLMGLDIVYKRNSFQAKDVAKIWENNLFRKSLCHGEQMICEGLDFMLNQKRKKVDSLSIGKALTFRRDRPVNGFKLSKVGENSNKISLWAIDIHAPF
jgi:hypothetical protein